MTDVQKLLALEHLRKGAPIEEPFLSEMGELVEEGVITLEGKKALLLFEMKRKDMLQPFDVFLNIQAYMDPRLIVMAFLCRFEKDSAEVLRNFATCLFWKDLDYRNPTVTVDPDCWKSLFRSEGESTRFLNRLLQKPVGLVR